VGTEHGGGQGGEEGMSAPSLAARVDALSPSQRVLLSCRLSALRGEDSPQRLVAFVKGTGDAPDGVVLQEHLKDRLPAYMVPSHFEWLDDLPRLPNGKMDRSKLKLKESVPMTMPVEKPDSVVGRLTGMWARWLGHPEITAQDNFFEWGGHSLLVLRLVDEIEKEFGQRLAAADIFERPTPQAVAGLLTTSRPVQDHTFAHVFSVQAEGRGEPIFCIQPDFFSAILTDGFRGERPIYGLRGVGLRPDGNWDRWETMTDLAQEMVGEITRCKPGGPYLVAGYSLGAVIAVEVVRVMELRGLPVEKLILFDPTPWTVFHHPLMRLQIRSCPEPVFDMSLGRALYLWLKDNNPLTDKPYRRLGRMLVAQPWRYFLRWRAKKRKARGESLTGAMMEADCSLERFRLFFAYQPQPVVSPTILFGSSDPDFDSAVLWKPCFRGPLTVHKLEDRHLALGHTPDVQRELVRQLKQELRSSL
jgi:thioesterase domain-containing protein/acyl carrier protein